MPEAVNAVVEVVRRVRAPVDVLVDGGRLSNTKAGMVKCWSLIFALHKAAALPMMPVIWTVPLGSPPVHVTSRPVERSTEVVLPGLVQVRGCGMVKSCENGPTSTPPVPETLYAPAFRKSGCSFAPEPPPSCAE